MRSQDTSLQFGRQRSSGSTQPKRSGLLFFCVFVALLLTNAATGVALYLAPEINTLFRQDNTAILTAYEQRIVQLRLEVDRLHSRQYAQMGDMNLQMHELVQQQEVLFEQHEYVRALADMAREMGIAANETQMPTLPVPHDASASGDVAALADTLVSMQEESRQALVALSDAASLSTGEIVSELQAIGITPSMEEPTGIGGPFIAAGSEVSIVEEANLVATALGRFQAAREALMSAPIKTPVSGNIAVSSSFGNRTDPFLKRAAFHAGVDFRAPSGTPILAAANGKVVHAGNRGGYGKMVDIDHGNGLVTRYAHMNAISVAVGQSIAGGERIGSSGSTGRSTGPHLHFEVRRNGSAINPNRFLEAGRNLQKFI